MIREKTVWGYTVFPLNIRDEFPNSVKFSQTLTSECSEMERCKTIIVSSIHITAIL